MKILLIAAMPTESEDIIKHFGMQLNGRLADFYPYYLTKRSDKEIFLIQTHVGSINAPTATALALGEIKPDIAIKIGCVGGNAPGFKKNDIIVPLSFFHSAAWITRSHINDEPTSNASLWQSLYGDEPYQNSKENLGGTDYEFKPDRFITNKYKEILDRKSIAYYEAYLGSGDMVIFDHGLMRNIRENVLRVGEDVKWCTDNESHSIAQVCAIFKVPFTGVYFIASSDFEDIGGYNPDSIRTQTQQTILPIIDQLIDEV